MAKDLLNMKLATILFGLLALVIITPRHCMADNFLLSPNSLHEGQFLVYGHYTFVLQREQCNLVLYDTGVAVWTSNSPPSGSDTLGCYATMQRDGNFVLYNRHDAIVWSTRSGQGGVNSYVLILQPDRNVVIYGPGTWATKTNVPPSTSILGQNFTATIVTSTASGGGDDAVKVSLRILQYKSPDLEGEATASISGKRCVCTRGVS